MTVRNESLNDQEGEALITVIEDTDFTFKIALLGDGAVGKTTLRKQFMGEGFRNYYLATIGADFSVKRLSIDGFNVQFQIWDIAGQPRFREVRRAYFMGADGGIFVHDITRPQTFQSLTNWLVEFWNNTKKGPVPIIVLSNKIDLEYMSSIDFNIIEDYLIRLDEQFQEKHGFPVRWFKTSALTGKNVRTAFEEVGRLLIAREISNSGKNQEKR